MVAHDISQMAKIGHHETRHYEPLLAKTAMVVTKPESKFTMLAMT